MKHARLGASSAHRWMHCTGSVRLTKNLPDIKTDYQREGTAAHTLAEMALVGDPEWRGMELVVTEGDTWPVDDEMRQGVEMYVDYVRALQTEHGGVLMSEQQVSLAALNPPEEMYGTSDAIIVALAKRRLDVVDFKYGQGVAVAAANNEQTLYYVLGALLKTAMLTPVSSEIPDAWSLLDLGLSLFDDIEVHIVQPRAAHVDGPIRSWPLSHDDIRAFAELVIQKARETQDPEAPLTPGDWCRFCPAQGHCPALQQHAQLVAQMDFSAVPVDTPPAPELLPIETVAEMLGKVPILEDWIRAMRARVERELLAGREVPGWKMVDKRAIRRWADERVVLEWAQGNGLEAAQVYADPELRSPAQMEKIVGKQGLPEELYEKVSSGVVLAPEYDPRPAAMVGPAADFAALPPSTEEQSE